ncbi:Methyltransferase domain-containing protein [Rhodovastum atsumiense]|nr:methyltransferase domain-containing protein [Rhodovastum atsumiense]CAH2604583.1 Methyltransferase domain-containing protein [Rhodovastum atsumiense]
MADVASISRHYARGDIAAGLLAALREAEGAEVPLTPWTLAPLDQFHGRGLDATAELAGLLAPRDGDHILDIGAGLGGPARWIAAQHGCEVTALDLIAEYCAAADTLTAACGLTGRVRAVPGSATDLPFADASFDHVFSQNAIMNIADKPRFYAEAFRVLRPGGAFALAQITLGPAGPPDYPQPWASDSATSFLDPPEAIARHAREAGFTLVALHDTTAACIAAQEEARRRIAASGPPRLGMHVLMGASLIPAMRNNARAMAEGRLGAFDCLLRKPL